MALNTPSRSPSGRYARMALVDYLVAALEQHGVAAVFTVPGSAVGPELERLLTNPRMRLVVARHESGAVAMADGYARVTGHLGAALVTSGPGALNALPHLAVAQADNSPVLLVSGAPARIHHGRGSFQEGTEDGIDTVGLFARCTKYSRELGHIQSAQTLLDNALRRALAAPRGATHVSIPVDLCAEQAEFPLADGAGPSQPGTDLQADADADDVAQALASAARPLLMLGNGARSALQSNPALTLNLVETAERFAIPVATTMKAKGLFPESHTQALGVFGVGGGQRARAYLLDSPPDVVVVVGSGLGEWATMNWIPALRGTQLLVQVDADPAKIGRAYPVDKAIRANADTFLTALLARLGTISAGAPPRLEARRQAVAALPAVTATAQPQILNAVPVKPQALMKEIQDWVDTLPCPQIFLDIGNGTGWFTQYIALDPPQQVHCPLGMASMGWANAAVIGAKLARPDNACVTVTGDGGFLMNAVEIATAAALHVSAIWVVLDDGVFNMVRQGMRHAYPETMQHCTETFGLGNVDLAGLAESLGARAHRVVRPEEIAAALKAAQQHAVQDRAPQVVCVSVDPDEPGPFSDRNEAVNLSFQAPGM